MFGEAHSVRRHLRVDAEGYDVQIRRFIADYDEMIATGVQVLAALAPADAHVLDLGGGTGALSSAVLDGLPGARDTVLDIDPDMLGETRRRLADFGDRVSFQQASFLDPLPAADAVVASLAVHHVHDLETKTALYRAIQDALSPGGVLSNLDAAVTEGARLNGLVFDRMAERMADHGISDAEAGMHLASSAEEDRYLFPVGPRAWCAARGRAWVPRGDRSRTEPRRRPRREIRQNQDIPPAAQHDRPSASTYAQARRKSAAPVRLQHGFEQRSRP